MSKKIEINEEALASITGGSIIVSPDYTTCGYNCNNEYAIVDLNGLCTYYRENMYTMSEQEILANCKKEGYIKDL